ncbi:MAG: ATP-binding protein, partial [Bacteroidales bacterium]|nr:ATP-binding protein [Bacteroidales bacterium]
MEFDYQINGGDFSSAGFASSHLKKILKQINIDPKLIKKIVIALYEAEVNIVAHAYEGHIHVQIEPGQIRLEI